MQNYLLSLIFRTWLALSLSLDWNILENAWTKRCQFNIMPIAIIMLLPSLQNQVISSHESSVGSMLNMLNTTDQAHCATYWTNCTAQPPYRTNMNGTDNKNVLYNSIRLKLTSSEGTAPLR
jgi:hypothetical protein